MTIKTLQKADSCIGVPICFFLTLMRVLFCRRPKGNPKPPRNLLFIKLAEQGSTVLAYPALRRAVERVGAENVYFMVFADNRFILDCLGLIPRGNVITVSVSNFMEFLRTAFGALRRLRGLNLDVAIDLEFFCRASAALAFLSGACWRVGFHAFFGGGPYRGNLMTHRVIYNPHLHVSQSFLMLVEASVCNPATLPTFNVLLPEHLPEPPPFSPDCEELRRVRDMLGDKTETLAECRPLFVLNPNSGDMLPLRRWPARRYVELAQRLLVRYPGSLVVFTGGPSEAGKVEQLVAEVASERCMSFAGKTTLTELLALYTIADVLITNDSGPAHFAGLTPVHVITLFGPETPELFAARTPKNTVLWAGLPCSPCISAYSNRRSPCRNNQCMQALSVSGVFEAVCTAFSSRRKPISKSMKELVH